jgi:two-component system LytT family response regulator
MAVRVLIVDDEPIARRGIRQHLSVHPSYEIVGECGNGAEAVRAIATLQPDLVFLDIQMPEMDGFGVINAVGAAKMPTVIFVTAYDQFALRAFEAHAIDYLLKPFDKARFARALDRARRQIEMTGVDDLRERLAELLREGSAEKHVHRLVIRSAGRIFFLGVDEIDWIEAADNYVVVHAGRDTHLLRDTMNRLESRLDPNRFVRIRRSSMVNVDRIKELRPLFHGEYEVVLLDGQTLASSRRYRGRVDALLA